MIKLPLSTALLTLALGQAAIAQDSGPMEEGSLVQVVPDSSTPTDPFARDSYRIDPMVCPFKGEVEYEPGDIECGLLQVPENREDPNSRLIELHFVKLNSRWGKDDDEKDDEDDSGYDLAPGKRDDAVIYLTGGPGAIVTEYVKRLKDHGILDHRDLYILEQRGIGFSGDFCPFYNIRKPALDDAETFEASEEAALQRMSDCAENARQAGVDLRGYNTIENARDVKALRRALGIDKWNVWGISYGSILGQAYVKEDPEGIRAVAIDAIMPLDILESSDYWAVVSWFDRDLRKIQEICDQQPACRKHYPDIGGRLRQAVRTVIDNPIVVEVKDTENFPSGKAHIFQDAAAYLPFMFLYEQKNYPGLPGLIYAWADLVERRDKTFFRALAASAGEGDFVTVSQGMYNAITCTDGDVEAQVRASKKDLREFPVLGSAMGSDELLDRKAALCAQLGMPKRPAEDYSPVQTDLPALIIDGEMDPITPPPNARAILPGFENGTYVEFPYAGHGPSRSVDCGGDMLNAFYDDPTAAPDLACVQKMEAPEMFAPLYTSMLVPKILLVAAEDKKKLAIPGAWAGLSLGVSLIAFLVLTFAPIVRGLDGREAIPAGAARLSAWLAATASVAAAAVMGAAIGVTAKTSELLPAFGFVPWARFGAWLGIVAGLFGLVTLFTTFRARRWHGMPGSRVLGFVLVGAAAIGLSAFMLTWGLGPF